MSEDQVKVRFVTEGAQQAARGAEGVADGLTGVATAGQAAVSSTRSATEATRAFGQTAQTGAQRIQGVSSAVQQLVSAMGSRNRTAGLVASIAGSTAQFAAMGSMLGPGGTVIGAISGLVVGLSALVRQNDATRDSANRATEALAAMGRAAIAARGERDRAFAVSIGGDTLSGAGFSEEELAAEREGRIARQVELRADAARARAEGRGADLRRTMDESERIVGELSNLDREIERLGSLPRGVEAPSASFVSGTTGGRGGGGGRREDPAEAARIAGMTERLAEVARIEDEIAEQEERSAEASATRHEAALREREERTRAAAEREFDLRAEMAEAAADAELEQQERIAEGYLAMKEAQEETDRRALESREQMAGELTSMLGDVTMTLGKTIAAVAMGEKTAGEAFDGLAAAFLEMISQYTTLKAGVEFADAAASFARYDYGGGAAHIAAGVAFTAVAVATGAGAAAIGAPPAAPAKPETSAATGGEARGGDTVINWNSPVVTASTEAGLGREIRGMLAAAGGI